MVVLRESGVFFVRALLLSDFWAFLAPSWPRLGSILERVVAQFLKLLTRLFLFFQNSIYPLSILARRRVRSFAASGRRRGYRSYDINKILRNSFQEGALRPRHRSPLPALLVLVRVDPNAALVAFILLRRWPQRWQ